MGGGFEGKCGCEQKCESGPHEPLGGQALTAFDAKKRERRKEKLKEKDSTLSICTLECIVARTHEGGSILES